MDKQPNKKSFLVMFQGVIFLASCFLFVSQSSALSSTQVYYKAYAYTSCISHASNSTGNCNGPAEGGSSCYDNQGNGTKVFWYSDSGNVRQWCYWSNLATHQGVNTADLDPINYDSENCLVVSNVTICEDNPYYVDSDGYDADGCVNDICPDDTNWVDSEGYDVEGFDSGGLDRGGNTAAGGGGYSGSAGTGGTPPSYLDVPLPEPLDPQNGNNANSIGNLYCAQSYPGYITIAAVGIYEYEAIGCANSCQYQYGGTSFDVLANQNILDYFPTGNECNGEEVALNLSIGQYIPDSECYEFGALIHCVDSQTQERECFLNDNGNLGIQVQCPADQTDTTVVDNSCGYANGVYQCFNSNDSCEFFAGDLVCIDSTSNVVIANDSPDHPLNGGNGDGNINNDIQSPSGVDTNLQPSTQSSIDELRLAGFIGQEVDNALSNEFAGLNSRLNTGNQSLSEIDARLNSIDQSLGADLGFDSTALEQGAFDLDILNGRIDQSKQEFLTIIDGIEFEAQSLIAFNSTEVGALPCPSFEISGASYEVCVSDYEDQLRPVGDFLVWIAYVMGFFMFVRRS